MLEIGGVTVAPIIEMGLPLLEAATFFPERGHGRTAQRVDGSTPLRPGKRQDRDPVFPSPRAPPYDPG